MPTIYIDNLPHQVKDGQNLLQACLGLGLNLPYFCWHPAMHSVGACRQCAVKLFRDENDTRGQIVMSCMTPVKDGMRLSVDDAQARDFRRRIIELLMVGHPHDCPVCDEGGECHLQDMTVMTGHDYRRYRFNKRTFVNQDMGPFVNHEMNRCIQCYRCVRYYCDYAGGRDFGVEGWHNTVYFGRFASGVLESEFSGNLVEICPTGVFTDKTQREHYARKWDLSNAPSICANCSVGCNTIPGERYGKIRRVHNRYHGQVNRYFLCDRGRYGYEFANAPTRPTQVRFSARAAGVMGATGGTRVAGVSPATGAAGSGMGVSPMRPTGVSPVAGATECPVPSKDCRGQDSGGSLPGTAVPGLSETAVAYVRNWAKSASMVGIGSPRASLESNFALSQLVGKDRFFSGLEANEQPLVERIVQVLRDGLVASASLWEVDHADAVLVLGEDLTNTAPMAALAVRQASMRGPMARVLKDLKVERWNDAAIRQAIQEQRGPIFIAAPQATKLDEIAQATHRAAPADIARFAAAVMHEIDATAPPVELDSLSSDLARTVAQALLHAQQPMVIAGTSLRSPELIDAAAALAAALVNKARPARLHFVVSQCNTMGVAMLGGKETRGAIEMLKSGQADTLVVLENDLYRIMPAADADALLAAARQVVVLDCIDTPTLGRADVVLPAASVFESDGTFVNNEGRAQRFYQVLRPGGHIRESWRWLAAGQECGMRNAKCGIPRLHAQSIAEFDAITAAMIAEFPAFAPVADIAPPADFRMHSQRLPRQHHRYSGRTAMTANISVDEPQTPGDCDSPLAFSMEGYRGGEAAPSALITRYWSPGWNSVQALTRFQQEIGGPLRGGDPGRRLLEPRTPQSPPVPQSPGTAVPGGTRQDLQSGAPREGQLLILPAWHIYGSELLSMGTPGVAQQAPHPYIALSTADAASLQLAQGAHASLQFEGETPATQTRTAVQSVTLAVRIYSELPAGVAMVPAGLAGLPYLPLPAFGRVSAHTGGPA